MVEQVAAAAADPALSDAVLRALILLQPGTVIRWHRQGFKPYWNWLSRHRISAGRE
jgi:hypothetical protein